MKYPYVILHVGMSLDGRLDWARVNQGLFYEIASRWRPDAMLSGSNTILAAEFPEEVPEEYQRAAAEQVGESEEERQLLFIVDSRGRIGNWPAIRSQPWWRDAVALCSESTPGSYLDSLEDMGVESIVTGTEKVDLRAALVEIRKRYGVEVLRVDSGGILNGALLREGLVDEVSVLISPELVGGHRRARSSSRMTYPLIKA